MRDRAVILITGGCALRKSASGRYTSGAGWTGRLRDDGITRNCDDRHRNAQAIGLK